MQTSAHPSATTAHHPVGRATTRPRAPIPAPFPGLPAASDPTYWVVVLQQNERAKAALERQIDANARASTRYDEALSHGLWAGLRELRRDSALAAQQLLLAGRILMAVPA